MNLAPALTSKILAPNASLWTLLRSKTKVNIGGMTRALKTVAERPALIEIVPTKMVRSFEGKSEPLDEKKR